MGDGTGGAPRRLELDVSAVAPAGCRRLVGDLFAGPAPPTGRPVLVVCLPGGGMSRRYFDLAVAGEPGGWSMARALAAAGAWVLMLDHPAVGESDVPDDPWTLHAATVADCDAAAVAVVVDGLRAGSLVDGVAAAPDLVVVGCGHSMGGLLVVHQQARHRSFDAVALLGFVGSGLPAVLGPEEAAFAGDPVGAQGAIRELAAARFGRPLAAGTTGASPMLLGAGVVVPEAAIAAIAASGSSLLVQPGLLSMIPGASRTRAGGHRRPRLRGRGRARHHLRGPPGDPRRVPGRR